MSAASIARSQERIKRNAVPRDGQTIEDAQRDALMTHQVLHAGSTAVLVQARIFFSNEDLKFVRQNGRWYLLIKTVTSTGGNAWRELSVGATPIEAFATARILVENAQREAEAKKAAETPQAEPQPEAQPV
jgi:hypothetical protein